MKILVLNSGSSSEKCCLYEIAGEVPPLAPKPLWESEIEWSGTGGAATTNAEITDASGSVRKESLPIESRRQEMCIRDRFEGREQAAGLEETCDTAGILNAAVGVVASMEAAEALKILTGRREALHQRLVSCDVWTGRLQSIGVARDPACRACVRRDFRYLSGAAQPHITMCGRDSIQIHERNRSLDLNELGDRLTAASASDIRRNEFLLRFRVPPYEMTVFANGRAILKGTQDQAIARSIYARYIGT